MAWGQDQTTVRHRAALAAAGRVARRILTSGGSRSEALQFLANTSARYCMAPTAIVILDGGERTSSLIVSAGIPEHLADNFAELCPLEASPGDGHATSEIMSVPIYSTGRKLLGTVNLYAANLDGAASDNAAALEVVADAAARILDQPGPAR